MKKLVVLLSLTVLLLVGCTNNQNVNNVSKNEENNVTTENVKEDVKETTRRFYQSENGPIEVPTNPERVVILDSSAAGSILLFGGQVVGHEVWTGSNPLFGSYLENSTEVAVDNLEQILALNPDLIIISSYNENYEELSQIAPTVSFTYGRLNYLDTIVEYAKVIDKEIEAKAWVETFKTNALVAGEKIKGLYGEDVSISVIESYGEEMYLYGDNWGRGTQIVYKEMGLTMTDAVKEVALTDGYYSISSEVVPSYAADLMIYTYFEGSNLSFKETETWKNIEAVQKGLVLEISAESFYMTGPITLDYQLSEIGAFFIK